MMTMAELPLELWAAIADRLTDLSSLTALFRANRRLRALGLRGHWAGLRRLELSTEADALLDAASGRRLRLRPFAAHLLPLAATSLRSLTLGRPAPHDARLGTPVKPRAQATLLELLSSPWQPAALRSLHLHEAFAAAPEAPALVTALAASLTDLSVLGCQTAGPSQPLCLLEAVGRCRGLASLALGFCKGGQSSGGLLTRALGDKPGLRELTLRGFGRLEPAAFLAALNGIRSKRLQKLALESVPYTNELFMEASTGEESRAVFAHLTHFRLAKCGFIYAPLILSVMPAIRYLQVSLTETKEMTKLALSYVMSYAGDVSRPRHELVLENDLTSLALRDFAAERLGPETEQTVRGLRRKFHLHFDVSVAEIPHPAPEGPVLAKRVVMGKGRAQVAMDTLFLHQRSLAVPDLP